MKNLVNAIRRNAEAYEQPRKAQFESDFAAFRRKFAAAFVSRPADPAPDGENPPQDEPEPHQDEPEPPQDEPEPPQDEPEPPKRKTARGKATRGKTGKR